MRRHTLVVALALSVLVAAGSAFAGAGGTNRPFRGSVVGMAIFDPANPKHCPAPFSVTTMGQAVGTASHLGLVTMTSSHCPLADGTVANADMTLVAANGDRLFGAYTGSSAPDGAYVVGHYTVTFTGGTGRFEGGTGRVTLDARVLFLGFDVLEWPGTWSWTGTLSY